jgi:small-conductance mechanosensitive channel
MGDTFNLTVFNPQAGELRLLLNSSLIVVGAILAGLILAALTSFILSRFRKETPHEPRDFLLQPQYWRGPLRMFLPALLVLMTFQMTRFPAGLDAPLRQLDTLVLIASFAWMLMRLVRMTRDAILSRYKLDAKDNLKARQVYTQMRVIERVLTVLIVVIAIATMLMTFDQVKQVGISILASAGIAGLVVGLAAQKTLGSLLAGIHLAISQPIRLDDVVIVEGEWGRIEEITLTYVVVKIWDLRRLIVPTTYFLEKPFQNWTRSEAAILGTVFLYVDYTAPVEAIRREFLRILDEQPQWDRQVSGLVVTNVTDRIVELRALMGATDSGAAWDLRCAVREKLLDFLQKNYPAHLPRMRVEMEERRGEEGPHENGK